MRHPSIRAAVMSGFVATTLVCLWAPACSSDSTSTDTAAPYDAAALHRDRASPPDMSQEGGGMCINCSMILGLLTGADSGMGGFGGGPPGGSSGGGPPGGGPPGGGSGGISFCSAAANGFVTCLQGACSTACPLGMGPGGDSGAASDGATPATSPEGGDAQPADGSADGATAVDCLSCLMAQCPTDLVACRNDK